MKLTTVTTMLKNNAVKLLATAALAGAALTTAAPAAQAQRVFFGVRLGGPVVVAPAPVYAPAPAPVFYYGYGPHYYGHPYFWHGRWYGRPYGWRR